MRVLVSPTENRLAELLGDEAIVSSIPEEKGADILIYSRHGLAGLQRKEVPSDFISSFTDGRMARELSLLTKSCIFSRLIGEGRFRYWPDQTVDMGMLKGGKRVPSRFTRKHVRGMLNDIEFIRGVMVDWTDDIDDTVAYIRSVHTYLTAGKHMGLYTRPSASGAWGVPTAKDTELWILQSFPGIGPSIADSIVEHFDNKIPLRWDCSLEELCRVPKLSIKRAHEIWGLLGGRAQGAAERRFDALRKNLGGGVAS